LQLTYDTQILIVPLKTVCDMPYFAPAHYLVYILFY